MVLEVAQVMWVMRAVANKNWVQPCGVMIVNSGQIALGAAAEHEFT